LFEFGVKGVVFLSKWSSQNARKEKRPFSIKTFFSLCSYCDSLFE
jgi:hypothetical protein